MMFRILNFKASYAGKRIFALPGAPRVRLRRNHNCGAFPPFGFNR